MSQQAWERAMGMRGYRGSGAEMDDRQEGIKVGGSAYLKEPSVKGAITALRIDDAGDPHFTLEFPNGDHETVEVPREDLRSVEFVEAAAFRR